MYYVYLIKSKVNNQVYVGFSSDLKSRVKQHNLGKVKYTKPFIPWFLIYYEAYTTEKQALKRESQIKKSRFEKLKILKRCDLAPSSSG